MIREKIRPSYRSPEFMTLGKASDPDTHHGMKILPLLKKLAPTQGE